MAKYRLFVACSFSDEMVNLRNYVSEQIEAQGAFIPVFGDDVDALKGPAAKVRDLVASCHAAMIIGVAGSSSSATPWIYSEVGMAYQQQLPILALLDKKMTDDGMMKYAVCYEPFDPARFTECRNAIWKGLVHLENAVEDLGPEIRSPENVLKKSLATILPAMLADFQASQELNPALAAKLTREIQQVLGAATNSRLLYAESDRFAGKIFTARGEKQRIADYVFKTFLSKLHDSNKGVVLDSGTVTFTICEKLIAATCRVKIITNNIAVGRQLSELPQYPCFILPGRLESKYLASLGEETDNYLKGKLNQEEVTVGFIAATSFSSEYGIAGNDPRHASFKKVILEECPSVVIVFEGEKILEDGGIPIYATSEMWNAVLDRRKDNLHVITHQPEQWDQLNAVKRSLYERTIDELKKKIGQDRVVALSP
jgi:DeoR/GlpR family transcriptional regulator of sugar metabolism